MTVIKAAPTRGPAPHSLTCCEVRPRSRLAHEYVRRASSIPRTFTFLLEQNLTPPSQKYLVSPSSRGYRLQGSSEGPKSGLGRGTRPIASRSEAAVQVKGRLLPTRRELGTRAPTAWRRRRGGRRTAFARLPAAVGARGHPRRLRAPAEHVRPRRAGSGPRTPSPPRPGWTRLPGPPGQRRVKEARSLPPAPSPLESP